MILPQALGKATYFPHVCARIEGNTCAASAPVNKWKTTRTLRQECIDDKGAARIDGVINGHQPLGDGYNGDEEQERRKEARKNSMQLR